MDLSPRESYLTPWDTVDTNYIRVRYHLERTFTLQSQPKIKDQGSMASKDGPAMKGLGTDKLMPEGTVYPPPPLIQDIYRNRSLAATVSRAPL